MEATTKYYKQCGVKSELLEVRYCEGHARLKGAQVAKWGRAPRATGWSGEDPLGCKKNKGRQCAHCSQAQARGSRQGAARLGAGFLLRLAVNCKLLCACAMAFLGLAANSGSTARPSPREQCRRSPYNWEF